MNETVKNASYIGALINSWGKIVGVGFLIVGGGFLTYYQIQTNAADNIKQDDKFLEWGNRSDNRYKRAMEESDELHVHIDKLNDQILDLYKRLYRIEGKIYK